MWILCLPPGQNIYSLHISLNSTIVDLRLNENKIRSVHYSSLSRFGNLTYLNLTKNDISYVEDGAFSAQFNLQVSDDILYSCIQILDDGCTRYTMEEIYQELCFVWERYD